MEKPDFIVGAETINEMFGPIFRELNLVLHEINKKVEKNRQALPQQQKSNEIITDAWVKPELEQLKRSIDFQCTKMITQTRDAKIPNEIMDNSNLLRRSVLDALKNQDYDTVAKGLACLQQVREEVERGNLTKNHELTEAKVQFIFENSPIRDTLRKRREQAQEEKNQSKSSPEKSTMDTPKKNSTPTPEKKTDPLKTKSPGTPQQSSVFAPLAERFAEAIKEAAKHNAARQAAPVQKAPEQSHERSLERF